MRTLKFRIWLTQHNQFVYPHLCDFIRGNKKYIIGQIKPVFKYNEGLTFYALYVNSNYCTEQLGTVNEHLDNIEHVIQQYIGLKDVDGKEIYEGDILECTQNDKTVCVAPVVFSPFGYGFVLDSSSRHAIGDEKHGLYVPIITNNDLKYKIVGNIFQNKIV